MRRISVLGYGWYVFSVKKVVEVWVNGIVENYGIYYVIWKKFLCKGFIEYLMIEFSYYIKWYYFVGFFVFMIFVIGYEVNGSYVRFV